MTGRDADAPLPPASALERFQAVAGARQVAQTGGGIKLVEFARGAAGEASERQNSTAPVERFGSFVGKADDHGSPLSRCNRPALTLAVASALRQAYVRVRGVRDCLQQGCDLLPEN